MKDDPDVIMLAHIGLVAAQWSTLEALFSWAIWHLLELEPETGKIVTGGLDMLPRANLAIRLCRHLKGPRPMLKALETARKTIQDGLDQRRNQAIHGIHYPAGVAGASMIEVHRGKGSGRRERISLVELERLCDDLKAARKPLEAILMAYEETRASQTVQQ